MTSDEEAAQGVGLHAAAAGIVAKLVFADGPYAEVSGQGMCQRQTRLGIETEKCRPLRLDVSSFPTPCAVFFAAS